MRLPRKTRKALSNQTRQVLTPRLRKRLRRLYNWLGRVDKVEWDFFRQVASPARAVEG